jgi:hypothetical protein
VREFSKVISVQADTDEILADHGGAVPSLEFLEDTDSPLAYALHSEKPLKKLLSRGGYDRVKWEVTTGRHSRLKLLWQAELARLELFRKQLQEIR